MISTIFYLIQFIGYCHAADARGSVKIEIIRLKNDVGQVGIVLHNRADAFPSDASRGLRSVFVKPVQKSVSYTFDDIPPGSYAIAVFHDEDSNKRLNTGIFGIPKEGYGTSNNVKGVFAPPSFKEASFVLPRDQLVQIQIRMIY